MAKRTKLHYVVNCVRHGKESDLWDGKQIKVNRPLSKRDRNTVGCPFCAQERQAEQARAAVEE